MRAISLSFLLILTSFSLWAQPAVDSKPISAHEAVEVLRVDLLKILDQRKSSELTEEYYQLVEGLFATTVDYGYVAREIMGDHAKSATPEQRQRFAEVLERSLMQTVAKFTLTLGADFGLEVVPPKGDTNKRGVFVDVKVEADGKATKITFGMLRNKAGTEWKLVKLRLDGIDMGSTFRAQFAQAMKKSNNLDEVIAGWEV